MIALAPTLCLRWPAGRRTALLAGLRALDERFLAITSSSSLLLNEHARCGPVRTALGLGINANGLRDLAFAMAPGLYFYLRDLIEPTDRHRDDRGRGRDRGSRRDFVRAYNEAVRVRGHRLIGRSLLISSGAITALIAPRVHYLPTEELFGELDARAVKDGLTAGDMTVEGPKRLLRWVTTLDDEAPASGFVCLDEFDGNDPVWFRPAVAPFGARVGWAVDTRFPSRAWHMRTLVTWLRKADIVRAFSMEEVDRLVKALPHAPVPLEGHRWRKILKMRLPEYAALLAGLALLKRQTGEPDLVDLLRAVMTASTAYGLSRQARAEKVAGALLFQRFSPEQGTGKGEKS